MGIAAGGVSGTMLSREPSGLDFLAGDEAQDPNARSRRNRGAYDGDPAVGDPPAAKAPPYDGNAGNHHCNISRHDHLGRRRQAAY